MLVRINSVRSSYVVDDITLIRALDGVDGVILPKVESHAEIDVASRLTSSRVVIPLLETAKGIVNASSILGGSSAVVPAVAFGGEDLTSQLVIERTLSAEELFVARSQVVLAAATIGAEPIDTVFAAVYAIDQLRDDSLHARALGFRGKLAVHPDQVTVINEVFTPSTSDVDRALAVIDVYESAHGRGEGIARLDGRMVGPPALDKARRTVALANAVAAAGLSRAKPIGVS
jgi:citrate lyase subunit beta/citryl-CoA lyase